MKTMFMIISKHFGEIDFYNKIITNKLFELFEALQKMGSLFMFMTP